MKTANHLVEKALDPLPLFFSSGGSEAYAPAATGVLPLDSSAFAGNVAGATFQAMLIRKVHLIAQEFKQPRGAYKNAGRRITPLTRLSIDANMGCFVNLEAYQFQTFLYGLHFINSLTWSLAIFLPKRTMLVRPANHHAAG
jgi:hypothetical protein